MLLFDMRHSGTKLTSAHGGLRDYIKRLQGAVYES